MITVEKGHYCSTTHVPSAAKATARHDFALVFTQVNGFTLTTRHSIQNQTLGQGTPVNAQKMLENVVAANQREINDDDTSPAQTELLPEQLLLDSADKLVWYAKAQTRDMWFRTTRSVQLRVRWPAVLFIVNKRTRSMEVFALASNRRPNAQTILYRAPFMNIDSHGLFCLGSASLPAGVCWQALSKMESCLYDSNFTHLNGKDDSHTVFSSDAKHMKFWRDHARTQRAVKVNTLPVIGRLSTRIR
jgi:PRTRC genetic system protein B